MEDYLDNFTHPGEVKTFNYTGTEQQILLYPGKYMFRLYGGRGHVWSGYKGMYGYGGYAYGKVTLDKITKIYLHVGGQGSAYLGGGGYNGGGTGDGNGGGASHIALVSGQLSSLYNNKDKVIIVAGGGGG